jgi:CxxC motif-containing protein
LPDTVTGREIVCIACPVGCRLDVRGVEGGEAEVTGNRCPKGEAYGREELSAPRRLVTAVVRTDSADFPCAPVRTDRPLPRERVRELMVDLARVRVALPVAAGFTIASDWKGTGVTVLVTRSLPPQEIPTPGEAGPEAEGGHQVALPQEAL